MQYVTNWSLPEIVKSSSGTTQTLPGLVSNESRMIFDHVVCLLSAAVVCVFGIVTNIINIIIFYKQGLDSTINISFFTLAIADLGSLITFQGSAISIHPSLVNSGIPFDFINSQYLFSCWPHICFGNITAWITAYIAAERCLCIALPLKVKQIITPKVTTVIISLFFLANIISIVPDFMYAYFDWKFDSSRNKSIMTINFRENLKDLEGVSFIAMAILGALPLPLVITFTAILVFKLRQQASWRNKSTRDTATAQLTSKREIKTMHMVVLIAVILIVCYIPGVLTSTNTFIFPSYNINGRHVNIWFMTWLIGFVCQAISSSINIFFYYRMSTKYKKTFHEMFKCCMPNDFHDLDE